MAFNAGVHIGPYEILALLGAGGMGEVYKARYTRLHRLIALKILPAEKVADADRKRRFLVEAQAASKLNHPNIVIIHDISGENSVCFIAMEYVPGTTLEQLNAGGGLPLKDTMKYSVEIADALAAAHPEDSDVCFYSVQCRKRCLWDHGYAAKREFQWGDVGPVWYLFIFS